jgi:hypothetical protein
MKTGSSNTGGYDYTLPNYAQPSTGVNAAPQFNEDAARVEQELLQSIKIDNPTR